MSVRCAGVRAARAGGPAVERGREVGGRLQAGEGVADPALFVGADGMGEQAFHREHPDLDQGIDTRSGKAEIL